MSQCPMCGNQMSFIDQYNQWYCYQCQQYNHPAQHQQQMEHQQNQQQAHAQHQHQDQAHAHQQPAHQEPVQPQPAQTEPAPQYQDQGELQVLKEVDQKLIDLGGGDGAGILIIDDLVDTGKTAKVVRERLPKAHFATVYAKPKGRPMVDTFVTEVSQDTWIYFPWDMGYSFQPPISQETAG